MTFSQPLPSRGISRNLQIFALLAISVFVGMAVSGLTAREPKKAAPLPPYRDFTRPHAGGESADLVETSAPPPRS